MGEGRLMREDRITGFIYRGLSPHKFTPMPGVPQGNPPDLFPPLRGSKRQVIFVLGNRKGRPYDDNRKVT